MNTENMGLKEAMDAQVVEVKDTSGNVQTMSVAEFQKHNELLARGVEMANMLVSKAMDQKDANDEFLVLRYMAVHILGGQIFNIGMGSGKNQESVTWDASRAFAEEKEVQDHISSNVQTWKNLFDNGHVRFSRHKVK